MQEEKKIVLGSRGSRLALWQTERVRQLLQEAHGARLQTEVRIVKTKGDRIQDAPLSKIGDKGLFTRDIELLMLAGEVDLAVHSLKDLPTRLPEGLALGLVADRSAVEDALVSRGDLPFEKLPQGARVATSSLRRQAQLLHYRPDLQIVDVRGNLETRLRKFEEQGWEGIVLARAGLQRLELEHRISEVLSPERFLPAVGQGALAVEIREGDQEIVSWLAPLHDPALAACVGAERALMASLEGGCQIPIAAHATVPSTGQLCLQAMVASLDGRRYLRERIEGTWEEAASLGERLGKQLLHKGGAAILADIRRQLPPERS